MFTLVRAGTEDVKRFEAAIKGAQGYASESRKIMDDTFKGAVFALQSAWEGLSIALQTPILDPLKNTVKDISAEMNRLSSGGIFQAIGKDIAAVFDSGGKSVVGFLRTLDWEGIKTGAKNATTSIETYFTDLVNSVRGKAQALSDISTTAFSPITVSINGYRIALALAAGDQEKVAKIQAEIDAQSAAISRTLNGTSAEFARLGGTAKAAGEQIQAAAEQQTGLQTAQQNATAHVRALADAVAAQEAKTAALSIANTRGTASTDEYGASVIALWTLQKQLNEAQARLTTTQEALTQAQAAGGEAAKAQADQNQVVAQTTATAAAATQKYSIEWSKAGAALKDTTGNIAPVVAGITNLSDVTGLATNNTKNWQTETERLHSSAQTLTGITVTTANSIGALRQKVIDANAALAEQKTAYDEAKKRGRWRETATKSSNKLSRPHKMRCKT